MPYESSNPLQFGIKNSNRFNSDPTTLIVANSASSNDTRAAAIVGLGNIPITFPVLTTTSSSANSATVPVQDTTYLRVGQVISLANRNWSTVYERTITAIDEFAKSITISSSANLSGGGFSLYEIGATKGPRLVLYNLIIPIAATGRIEFRSANTAVNPSAMPLISTYYIPATTAQTPTNFRVIGNPWCPIFAYIVLDATAGQDVPCNISGNWIID